MLTVGLPGSSGEDTCVEASYCTADWQLLEQLLQIRQFDYKSFVQTLATFTEPLAIRNPHARQERCTSGSSSAGKHLRVAPTSGLYQFQFPCSLSL